MMYLSAFFQEGPAQTTNYMIFGYTVIFGCHLSYTLPACTCGSATCSKIIEAMKDLQEE